MAYQSDSSIYAYVDTRLDTRLPRSLRLGWPTCRTRQFIDLRLKKHNTTQPGTDDLLEQVFFRNATFSVQDYCIGDPSDTKKELEWALQRRSTIKRQAEERALEAAATPGEPALESPNASIFFKALGGKEQQRLKLYTQTWPGFFCDLNQNPLVTPIKSKSELHTLTKSMGLIWNPVAIPNRWLFISELAAAMGYPVLDSHVEQAGVDCLFSHCRIKDGKVSAKRSRSSSSNQLGNAMHVNSIGAVSMALFFSVPDLISSSMSPVQEPGAPSQFTEAVRELLSTPQLFPPAKKHRK